MYDSHAWLCFLTAIDQRHTPIDNTDLSAQMRARGEDLEQAEAERTKVNQEVKKVELNLKHLGDEVAKQVCDGFSLFSGVHFEGVGGGHLPSALLNLATFCVIVFAISTLPPLQISVPGLHPLL